MISTFAYAWRNVRRRPARALLGAVGIMGALALLTAIQVGLDSLSISYIELLESQTGKADVVITRSGSELLSLDSFNLSELPPGLANSNLLTQFSGRVQGIAVVRCDGVENYAVLAGVDFPRESAMGFPSLPSEDSIPPKGQCVLSEGLAARLNVEPGGKVQVRAINNYADMDLTVADVVGRQFLLPQQFKNFILVDLSTGQELLGEPGRVHLAAAAFRDRRLIYDARNLHQSVLRLKGTGGEMATFVGPRFSVRMPKAGAITAFQEITAPLRAFFGVFALLALTITGLLIYSLIAVAVEERIREYGILRTVGARKGLIFKVVLAEAFLLCFIGAVPGVGAGLVLAKALVALVGAVAGGGTSAVPLDIRPATLALTLGAGVLLALGSAFVPALNATRWRIVDALDPLRKGQIPATSTASNPDRPLVLAGAVLSVLAGIIFFVLPAALFSGNPSVIGSIVLCLLLTLLLGFTMAGMGVLPMARRALLFAGGRVFAPVTGLVQRNLERHRRRHTTTSLLFTLSVSLVLFVASLVALFSKSAMTWVDHSLGAELRVFGILPDAPSLKPDLLQLEDAKSVSETRFLRSRSTEGIAYDVVIGDLVGMKDLWVVPFGADPDLARTLNKDLVVYESGPGDALEQICAYRSQSSPTNTLPPVILSLAAARWLEVRAGDPVVMSFRLGSRRKDGRFRVLAVCESLPGFKNFRGRVALAVGSGILMPQETFDAMTTQAPESAFQVAYFLKSTGNAKLQKRLARTLREKFDLRFRFTVECAAEQKESARAVYWITQVFFGLLLAGAVMVAVLALIASMTVTVMERQREIGILRALGLRRNHLFRLFYGEAVVLTLSAGITGGLIGFALAWLFVAQSAALIELPILFTMPYLTFCATIAISLVSGVIAAYVPARGVLKKNAAEILRS